MLYFVTWQGLLSLFACVLNKAKYFNEFQFSVLETEQGGSTDSSQNQKKTVQPQRTDTKLLWMNTGYEENSVDCSNRASYLMVQVMMTCSGKHQDSIKMLL